MFSGEMERTFLADVPGSAPKGKQRRVIKQRQSLAEKERGTTLFPLSRIKRIIKADKELEMMTNEACFMISVATVGAPPMELCAEPDELAGILHQAFHGGRVHESEVGQEKDCQLQGHG